MTVSTKRKHLLKTDHLERTMLVQLVQNNVTPVQNKVTLVQNNVTPVQNKVTLVQNNVTPVQNNVTPVQNKVAPVQNKVAPVHKCVELSRSGAATTNRERGGEQMISPLSGGQHAIEC